MGTFDFSKLKGDGSVDDLLCLRCEKPMRPVKTTRIHTGGIAWEFASGGLSSDRLDVQVWRCGSCGKIELFDPL